MREAITAWLKNPGRLYSEGLRLYLEQGTNAFYKTVFLKGESSYTRPKLVEELKKLAAAGTPEPPPKAPEPLKRYSELKVTPPGVLPEELKFLQVKKGPMYREMSMLHKRLLSVTTEKERFEIASRILDQDEEIKAIWKQIDDFQEQGILPQKKDAPPELTDPVQIMRRIESLKSYIRRASKRGSSEDQVKAWKHELTQLQQKIN